MYDNNFDKYFNRTTKTVSLAVKVTLGIVAVFVISVIVVGVLVLLHFGII